jgi:prepilin signal peptidase PulO-like enzyme (type II secretory pathway)
VDTHHHHLVPFVLHLILGGFGGLTSASLAGHFGWRAADRLPGEGRLPQCVYCLKTLEWNDTFPLFGWLLRRQALTLPCPCGARKGLWPQPLIEAIGFTFGVIAMWLAGWSWGTLPLIIGLGLFPAIALIDLYFGVIPDELNLIIAVSGLAWAWVGRGDVSLAFITAAALLALGLFLALVYSRLRGREMLGLGDVKFFAAAGFWLQPELAPWFLSAAGILGVLFSFAWRYGGGGRELPFAPALCCALAACVFYQLMSMPLPL